MKRMSPSVMTFLLSLFVVLTFDEANSSLLDERQIRSAGGYSSVNVEDVDVREMADFATNAISLSSNFGPSHLVRIVKAEKQIVAGANYKLTLELNSIVDGDIVCDVIVFDQPWTDTRKLSESSCMAVCTSSNV